MSSPRRGSPLAAAQRESGAARTYNEGFAEGRGARIRRRVGTNGGGVSRNTVIEVHCVPVTQFGFVITNVISIMPRFLVDRVHYMPDVGYEVIWADGSSTHEPDEAIERDLPAICLAAKDAPWAQIYANIRRCRLVGGNRFLIEQPWRRDHPVMRVEIDYLGDVFWMRSRRSGYSLSGRGVRKRA